MTTCFRYYLDPSGNLVAREEPGRCERFWGLWDWRRRLEVELARRPAQPGYDQLVEEIQEYAARVDAHVDVCPTCRAWLERCDEAGAQGWLAVLERDNRAGDYLNIFGLRPGRSVTQVEALEATYG